MPKKNCLENYKERDHLKRSSINYRIPSELFLKKYNVDWIQLAADMVHNQALVKTTKDLLVS